MESIGTPRSPGPLVSVIIPCRDATHLDATLDSLAGQEDAPPYEVVVVNDSVDGDLSDRFASTRDRLDLRVIKATRRGAPGANRNLGVSAAGGDVLLFVDADDIVGPTYVRAMTRALDTRDVVCARIELALLNPPKLGSSHHQQTGLITDRLGFLPFASAGTIGIHRSVFEQIGGFDASLVRYAEADLCWRLQLSGMEPPSFVSEAVSHHRLERRRARRWRKALMYGGTGALLYSRYRGAGMPRSSTRDALAAWLRLPWRLAGHMLGHSSPGLGWEAALRLGRLQGSLRHRVIYL